MEMMENMMEKMMEKVLLMLLLMPMMETSSFAWVLIFLPAVVGLFPGPPPWSTCHQHDVMMMVMMMANMAMMMVMAVTMMQFFLGQGWPGMVRILRMVRIGTLSLANRVLMKLFLEPCNQSHSENV